MNLNNIGINTVSFDIGNTLINLEGVLGLCTYFCKETGLKVDDIRDVLNENFLKKNLGIEESVKEVCKILQIDNYESIVLGYRKLDAVPKVYPDVINTLKKIKEEGYRIIACSNCTKSDADISNHRIYSYFDKVFYSFEIGYAKPEIEFFNYVTRVIKADGSEILHIGDSIKADYYAARAAGWRAILLDRKGCNERPNIPIIHSLNELTSKFSSELLKNFIK